jgi:hypothetical protein
MVSTARCGKLVCSAAAGNGWYGDYRLSITLASAGQFEKIRITRSGIRFSPARVPVPVNRLRGCRRQGTAPMITGAAQGALARALGAADQERRLHESVWTAG